MGDLEFEGIEKSMTCLVYNLCQQSKPISDTTWRTTTHSLDNRETYVRAKYD